MDRKAENAVDTDEEDEDFVPETDDAGSPTGNTDEEGSDEDVKAKEPAAPKPTSAAHKKRERGENDGGGKKKKKKKKREKLKDGPRRPMSGFMYFSQAEREELKKKQPSLPFKEVGKFIGARWKELSKEDKETYENRARLDKARYKKEMAEYKSGGITMEGEPLEV